MGQRNNVKAVGKCKKKTITLSTDLITDNVITATVNGTALTSTTYNVSHVATWAVFAAKIAALDGIASATPSGDIITIISESGTDIIIETRDDDDNIATYTISIAGGVSQPTITIDVKQMEVYLSASTTNERYYLKSVIGYSDTDSLIKIFSDTDRPIITKALTFSIENNPLESDANTALRVLLETIDSDGFIAVIYDLK